MSTPDASLLDGISVDRRLNLRAGTAVRLARRRKLPHVVLPDGSIRFEWEAVEAILQRVPVQTDNPHVDSPLKQWENRT